MKFYKRAYQYIFRKRIRSMLLCLIFMIALFVGMFGISLLSSFREFVQKIGTRSGAKVTVMTTEMDQRLSNADIESIQSLENIYFTNRVNEINVRPEGFDISVGNGENVDEAMVRIQGFDDLAEDSLFALQKVAVVEGDINISSNEIIIYDYVAFLNQIEVGDELCFTSEQGETITTVVGGIYVYTEVMEFEEYTQSMFRFENLMFAHPELVNKLQSESSYLETHFYAIDPAQILVTQHEIETLIKDTSFETKVSDTLFRKISSSLEQASNLITMILIITGISTTIALVLLLILWAKERKKEVALFLSIGESKQSIILQRLLEGGAIYIVAFVISSILTYFTLPYAGAMLLQNQIEIFQTEKIDVILNIYDVQKVFFGGAFVLLLAIMASSFEIMRLAPRAIFSAVE